MSVLQHLTHAVWADNSGIGRLIVVVTLAVAARALWRSFQADQRLFNEHAWIDRCQETLAAHSMHSRYSRAENEAEASPSASGAFDLEELGRIIMPSSLIGDRIRAIGQLRRQRVKVALPILQQLTRLRLATLGELTAARRAASLCIYLGLFGTFIGLAVMVQEMQGALPQALTIGIENWLKGIENVNSVLGGIRMAFAASLIGIFVAIPLAIVDNRLERKLKHYQDHLEQFTTLYLLPTVIPNFQDESLLERLTLQMESSFDRLETIFSRQRDTLQRLEGAEKIFLEIIDELRASERNNATRDFGQLTHALSETQRSVVEVVDQLPRIVDAIAVGQRNFLRHLNPWHQIASGLGHLWAGRIAGIPGSVILSAATIALGYCVLYVFGLVPG